LDNLCTECGEQLSPLEEVIWIRLARLELRNALSNELTSKDGEIASHVVSSGSRLVNVVGYHEADSLVEVP